MGLDDASGGGETTLSVSVHSWSGKGLPAKQCLASAGSNGDPLSRPITTCPCCSGGRMQRWGMSRTKVQRWRCRDCLRSCSSTSGTLLARCHSPEKRQRVVVDMLSSSPSTCRQLAADLGVSAMTAWAWRQKISAAFAAVIDHSTNEYRVSSPHELTTGTTILRESRKASREWVIHQRAPDVHPAPNRLRWVDYRRHGLPLPSPMTPFLVAVQIVSDGADHASVVPSSILNAARPSGWAGATVLMPDATMSSGSITHNDAGSAVLEASRAISRVGNRGAPIPCGAPLGNAFERFLRPFRGPATKHLAGYVAWFLARLSSPDEGRQAALCSAVCGRLAS